MSSRKKSEAGFTLIEMLVTMGLITIIAIASYTVINSSTRDFLSLQQDGVVFGDLASQSQRIAQVLRGLTDITQATADEITCYAYFYPQDSYVSLVHYYKNAAGNILYADVTPMTSNPPIGTPISASKKTYKIIDPFYAPSGVSTFTYLDPYGVQLPIPVTDLHTIKEINVTLAVPVTSPIKNSNDTISLLVSLRNRKTNL
jgi:prepilin-type N-terminal cleavage/methylation domain-containing protein